MDTIEQMYSVELIAERWNISERVIRRGIRKGQLRAVRDGFTYKCKARWVNTWLEEMPRDSALTRQRKATTNHFIDGLRRSVAAHKQTNTNL